MIFLKGLLFILWNIALGSLLIYSIKWFLFNPKPRKFLGIRNPLTPGFLVRKRDWLFNKGRDLLHDYLEQASNEAMKNGYLHSWEEQIWKTAWEKTDFVDEWKFMPNSIKNKIHEAIAGLAKSMGSKILRKTVPHFIEQLRLEHKIDELDAQFSIEFIYKYFRQYVYKPLLLAFLAINFIIGLMNMILYLIIA